MKLYTALSAAILLSASLSEARSQPLDRISGHYTAQNTGSTAGNAQMPAKNSLDLVPVTPNDAYFRIALQTGEQHRCAISGIGVWDGSKLIYKTKPASLPRANPPCILIVQWDATGASLYDKTGVCKVAYCTGTSGFSGVHFPLSGRSSVNNAGTLRQSTDYAEALSIWRTSRFPMK